MGTVSFEIPGYPSSNRVPGAFGDVEPGVGGQSAADLPKKTLIVGLAGSSGTITPDTQVVEILSEADADLYAQAGSEGACMLYDALAEAGDSGEPIYYCSPKPAGGAAAATLKIKFGGTTASVVCSIAIRIAGQIITQGIQIGDTPTVVATNLAGQINGFNGGRLPCSATASSGYLTITCRTPGVRGMQHVVFLDTTGLPSTAGITATLYATWAGTTPYALGDQVIPATANGYYYQCTTAGTSGSSTPTFPTTIGQTVTDGTATWTCWGTTATGSKPTVALFLGNGTGLETYTNLLATLSGSRYDRIGLACNDATSAAAWQVQLDEYAAAPYNFLQHAVMCVNGSLSSATSLGQTTCNDPRLQVLWNRNGETHPSRNAAAFAARRASDEASNPNASYDDYEIRTCAPQTQAVDQPLLSEKISAINNSVTPLCSSPGDNACRIVRSITTKSLTGGNADYSTLDTGQMSTPDFVFDDAKLYYTSVLRPANPVAMDDPAPGGDRIPAGVLTPSYVASKLKARLVQFSKGILSGDSQTVAPIVQAPTDDDVQGTWDNVGKRPMIAETVRVMDIDHALGVSVRQSPT